MKRANDICSVVEWSRVSGPSFSCLTGLVSPRLCSARRRDVTSQPISLACTHTIQLRASPARLRSILLPPVTSPRCGLFSPVESCDRVKHRASIETSFNNLNFQQQSSSSNVKPARMSVKTITFYFSLHCMSKHIVGNIYFLSKRTCLVCKNRTWNNGVVVVWKTSHSPLSPPGCFQSTAVAIFCLWFYKLDRSDNEKLKRASCFLLNDRVDRAKVRGAFINGQGIRRKVHEVGGILRNLHLDVIGIAETWLLPGERVEVDGYRWIGIPREGNVR